MSEYEATKSIPDDPDDDEITDDRPSDEPEEDSPTSSETESSIDDPESLPEHDTVRGVARANSVTEGGEVIGVQNNFYQQEQILIESLEKEFLGDAFFGPTRLSPDHFEPFVKDRLVQNSRRIIYQHEELEDLESRCERHRILLLEGPPNVGKGSLVECLAARLCRERGPRELKVCRHAFSRRLKVSLRTLISEKEDFRKSVILIENIFDHENEDMLEFARETNELRLKAFEDELDEANSFLIFTYDTGLRPAGLHPVLRERVLEIHGPSKKQLETFLIDTARRRLEGNGQQGPDAGRPVLDDIVSRHASTLIEQLRSLPRIEIFVCGPLLKLARRQNVTLDDVLMEIERLDRGCFQEESEDLDALVYLLALTICHAGPKDLDIPWFHFEGLRHRIETKMRQELRLENEQRPPRELSRESELLRRFGAEVIRGAEGDRIRFLDPERPAKLWIDLLGDGRRLAAAVVPVLEELSASPAYYLRWHAGWALGRLSQLDHHGLFGRLFHRWAKGAKSQPPHQAKRVGSLVQGALLSGDQRLASLARGRVCTLYRDSNTKEAEVALLILGEAAHIDFPWALAEMRQIVQNHLLPPLDSLETWETERRRIESTTQRLTGSANWRRLIAGLHDEQLEQDLKENLPRLFPDAKYRVLMAWQYTLVGLCFGLDAGPLLRELKSWMPAGETRFSRLLALLFLRPRGLVEILERFPVRVSNENRNESWSTLLVAAAASEKGPRKLAELMLDLHMGARQLPGAMGRALEKRWYTMLVKWTRQACGSDMYRPVVIDLWRELHKTLYPEIRDKLADLLDDPEFGAAGTKMEGFVQEIRQALTRRPGLVALADRKVPRPLGPEELLT